MNGGFFVHSPRSAHVEHASSSSRHESSVVAPPAGSTVHCCAATASSDRVATVVIVIGSIASNVLELDPPNERASTCTRARSVQNEFSSFAYLYCNSHGRSASPPRRAWSGRKTNQQPGHARLPATRRIALPRTAAVHATHESIATRSAPGHGTHRSYTWRDEPSCSSSARCARREYRAVASIAARATSGNGGG